MILLLELILYKENATRAKGNSTILHVCFANMGPTWAKITPTLSIISLVKVGPTLTYKDSLFSPEQ